MMDVDMDMNVSTSSTTASQQGSLVGAAVPTATNRNPNGGNSTAMQGIDTTLTHSGGTTATENGHHHKEPPVAVNVNTSNLASANVDTGASGATVAPTMPTSTTTTTSTADASFEDAMDVDIETVGGNDEVGFDAVRGGIAGSLSAGGVSVKGPDREQQERQQEQQQQGG
ncbi:hypothetical protein HDU76_014126, partial [Blyttiomyces sp. JEL0837]